MEPPDAPHDPPLEGSIAPAPGRRPAAARSLETDQQLGYIGETEKHSDPPARSSHSGGHGTQLGPVDDLGDAAPHEVGPAIDRTHAEGEVTDHGDEPQGQGLVESPADVVQFTGNLAHAFFEGNRRFFSNMGQALTNGADEWVGSVLGEDGGTAEVPGGGDTGQDTDEPSGDNDHGQGDGGTEAPGSSGASSGGSTERSAGPETGGGRTRTLDHTAVTGGEDLADDPVAPQRSHAAARPDLDADLPGPDEGDAGPEAQGFGVIGVVLDAIGDELTDRLEGPIRETIDHVADTILGEDGNDAQVPDGGDGTNDTDETDQDDDGGEGGGRGTSGWASGGLTDRSAGPHRRDRSERGDQADRPDLADQLEAQIAPIPAEAALVEDVAIAAPADPTDDAALWYVPELDSDQSAMVIEPEAVEAPDVVVPRRHRAAESQAIEDGATSDPAVTGPGPTETPPVAVPVDAAPFEAVATAPMEPSAAETVHLHAADDEPQPELTVPDAPEVPEAPTDDAGVEDPTFGTAGDDLVP